MKYRGKKAHLFKLAINLLLPTILTYPHANWAAEWSSVSPDEFPNIALNDAGRIDSLLQRSITLTISQKYNEALALADSVIRLASDEPVGFLFRAAVLQSRMLDYETVEDEKAFFQATTACRKLAQKKVARWPPDAWAHFFLGSALGYEAFWLGKKRRHLEAFRAGWQCIYHLEAALKLNSQLYDAYLGIGTYKYYRSKLSKDFTWLPFVEDEREVGKKMIRQAIARGRYSRYAAINGLTWILLEENRAREAMTLIDSALAVFPRSRFFLWGAAEAAFRLGRYDSASDHYKQILRSLQNENHLSPYLEVVGRTRLAKAYLAANKTGEACRELERMEAIKLPKAMRGRGQTFLEEAARYRKDCPDFPARAAKEKSELTSTKQNDIPHRVKNNKKNEKENQ
jgi:tetratricopeptide (TPR) repeat protein